MSEHEPEARADSVDADASELEDLVAEHPEEVARVLERLGLVNDLLDTADLATAAMDDQMVQELSGTATTLAAAADGLATPDAAKRSLACSGRARSRTSRRWPTSPRSRVRRSTTGW